MKTFASRRPNVGFLLLVGTGLIWGTIGVAAKYTYQQSDLDAVSVTWLRAVIASPFCLLMAWRSLGNRLFAISKRDFTIMSLLGVALIVYQFFYLAAINRIGISAATLISLCGAPVLVAIASVLFLGDRMTRRTATALTGALLGVALIVGWRHGAQSSTRDTIIGVSLAIGSAIGVATHFLVSRSIAARQHPLRPLAIGFTSGAIAFTPFVLWRGISLDVGMPAWSLLFYLALGPSVVAYWMYQRGLQDVPATDASIVTLLEPLIAAILAAMLFNERLGIVGSVGALLLVGSIALLTLTTCPSTANEVLPLESLSEATP
jgi:DME family drug/metabolite transporter